MLPALAQATTRSRSSAPHPPQVSLPLPLCFPVMQPWEELDAHPSSSKLCGAHADLGAVLYTGNLCTGSQSHRLRGSDEGSRSSRSKPTALLLTSGGTTSGLIGVLPFQSGATVAEMVQRAAGTPTVEMQAGTLKEVSADGPKRRIVVRLPRIWESKGLRDGVIYEIGFVAVDHEGTMMEGNVPSAYMHKFIDVLKEGAVYAIQGYMVKPARKSYRAVDNHHRITITQYTKVQPVNPEPENIPSIPYKLQLLSVLDDRYASKNIVLSDVAGILIELTGVIYPTGEGNPRRNMKIQDMDENQFTITLWGHEAENFDEDAVRTISAQGSVTILFVSMATEKFRDKLSLKFTNLSRYYIDADVPISSALKRKYRNEANQVQLVQMDNARAEAAETTLLGLSKQDKGDIEGKFFKVAIEITDIDAKAWWFWVCDSCVKLTRPNGSIFTCTGTQCTCISGSKRYIINAYAKDVNYVAGDEEVMGSFAFFGKQGKRLIGQDEDVVYTSTEEGTGSLPPAVANVIGKKFLVTARITQEIYAGDTIPFRVASTEPIGSPAPLPSTAAAVGQALIPEEIRSSPQSPPVESTRSTGSLATPPGEVIEEYGSDGGEDVSTTSDERKRRSKNVPPSSAKK